MQIPNMKDVDIAAHAFGREVHAVIVGSEDEFDLAFASLAQMRVAALFVVPDPFLFSQRQRIVAKAVEYALPTITTVGKPSPMAV